MIYLLFALLETLLEILLLNGINLLMIVDVAGELYCSLFVSVFGVEVGVDILGARGLFFLFEVGFFVGFFGVCLRMIWYGQDLVLYLLPNYAF